MTLCLKLFLIVLQSIGDKWLQQIQLVIRQLGTMDTIRRFIPMIYTHLWYNSIDLHPSLLRGPTDTNQGELARFDSMC